jgi:hypothetical protein
VLSPLGKLAGLTGGFGSLFGIGAAAGLVEVVKSSAESMHELGIASEKTGVGATALARLHYAAKQSNVETDALDKSLFRLNVRIDRAARGKNKDLAAMFRTYFGPKWKNQITDATTGLGAIADLVAKIPNQARRSDIISALFGSRSGADLLPLLARGSAGLQGLYDDYKRLYGDATPQMVKTGTEAVEAFRQLETATSGLTNAIGLALAPEITNLIKPLSEWIANNRELVRSRVSEWAKEVGDALRNVDWKLVGKDALQMVKDAKTLLDGVAAVARGVRDVYELFHPESGMRKLSDSDRAAMIAALKQQGLTEATPEWTANFLRQRDAAAGRATGDQNGLVGGRALTAPMLSQLISMKGRDTSQGRLSIDVNFLNMPTGVKASATKLGNISYNLNIDKRLNVGVGGRWGF